MQANNEREYQQCLTNQTVKQAKITNQIKDIVFDYFNMIGKEYEITYEKWKNDDEYKRNIEAEKAYVENEFIKKKFSIPLKLTKEKTQDLLQRKLYHEE